MATHSSILAWRIPWTEEPGRLQSIGSQKVRHELKRLSTHAQAWITERLQTKVKHNLTWGKSCLAQEARHELRVSSNPGQKASSKATICLHMVTRYGWTSPAANRWEPASHWVFTEHLVSVMLPSRYWRQSGSLHLPRRCWWAGPSKRGTAIWWEAWVLSGFDSAS